MILREARLEAGLTQAGLSRAVREKNPGYMGRRPARESISRIERGRAPLKATWDILRTVLELPKTVVYVE